MSLSAEAAVQEELTLYLSEKGVNSLFVKIVEQLLVEKPDSPVAYIIQYLLDNFPEETQAFGRRDEIEAEIQGPSNSKSDSVKNCGASLKQEQEESKQGYSSEDASDSESESESDEDNFDEENMHQIANSETKVRTATTRRSSVSAAVINLETAKFEKKVFDKTDEERSLLKRIVSETVLCSHLDEEEQSTIVDAFEKTAFTGGTEIITQGDTQADHYFVLESGKAEVILNGEKILEYNAGDGFGELALMYCAPRAATVRTMEDCIAWRLDQFTFKAIVMGSALKKRKQYVHFLKTVPILAEMAEYERQVLADALTERVYKSGEVIVTQGDPGDEFFIIANGSVKVERDGNFVSNLEQGKYFGEIALLTSKKRQASVVADTETVKVLLVHRKVFSRVLGPLSDILSRNMDNYSNYLLD